MNIYKIIAIICFIFAVEILFWSMWQYQLLAHLQEENKVLRNTCVYLTQELQNKL